MFDHSYKQRVEVAFHNSPCHPWNLVLFPPTSWNRVNLLINRGTCRLFQDIDSSQQQGRGTYQVLIWCRGATVSARKFMYTASYLLAKNFHKLIYIRWDVPYNDFLDDGILIITPLMSLSKTLLFAKKHQVPLVFLSFSIAAGNLFTH